MKITTSKEILVDAVHIMQYSVSAKTTLPILLNFLLSADNGKMKFTRTDLETAVIHNSGADIEKSGEITIPAKEFSEIINLFPSGKEISIYTGSQNKVHIECGKSKFWLAGTGKEDYPMIPDMDKSDFYEMSVRDISQMIEKTVFCASNQETRYVLNGVLWNIEGDVFEMAATDGRRLALSANKSVKTGKKLKIIVPSRILNDLNKHLVSLKTAEDEKIKIGVSSNQISFAVRETIFISRLIEGNFPNYKQVIPEKSDIIFSADVKELLSITKRAELCVGDRGGAVKYELKKGRLEVSSASQKMEFSDEIAIDYKGEDFKISFNPQYIIDILKNISSEKAEFGLTTPVNPVLVCPAGSKDDKYVVMPVRI